MRVLVVIALLGLCAWRTHAQLETWRSDEALWRRAVAVSPGLPRPALNVAHALLRRRALEDATHWARRAVALAAVRSDPVIARKAEGLLAWIEFSQRSALWASSAD